MGKKIDAWQALDGAMFNTEAEMLAHEDKLMVQGRIQAYLETVAWNRGGRTRAERVLIDYEDFCQNGK